MSHVSAPIEQVHGTPDVPNRIGVMKNRAFLVRLSFATLGIIAAWRRERSFRTQVIIGIAASAFTAALAPSLVWAAAIALSIALVLALELLNTALECVVDHLHPET